MSTAALETRSVVIDRDLPHPPAKVWRALTQSELIGEWLMPTDFSPVVGHRFGFNAEWGRLDCQVLDVDPERELSYSWGGLGLESVVTWTLTPTDDGTRLRMEQVGFRPDQDYAYNGARLGWPRFLGQLDALLAKAD